MGIEAPRKLAMLSFLLMTFTFFLIKGYLMKTVRLGRTGVPVSQICFGTMSFVTRSMLPKLALVCSVPQSGRYIF